MVSQRISWVAYPVLKAREGIEQLRTRVTLTPGGMSLSGEEGKQSQSYRPNGGHCMPCLPPASWHSWMQLGLPMRSPLVGTWFLTFGTMKSYRPVCPVACTSFLRTYWRTVGEQQERPLRAETCSVLMISHQLHQVQGLQQTQPQVLPGPISWSLFIGAGGVCFL